MLSCGGVAVSKCGEVQGGKGGVTGGVGGVKSDLNDLFLGSLEAAEVGGGETEGDQAGEA